MPRVKSSVTHRSRVSKIRKRAKGFFGKRKNVYTVAKHTVMRANAYSFTHRRLKKRDFSALWNIRINAALHEFGLSYSKFMGALKKANVFLNRKSLSNLAIEDNVAFSKVVEIAKSYL